MISTIDQYYKKNFWQDLPGFVIVFLAYFVSARVFLDIYYHFQTSPALIWPPVGIAILAVLFFGYRMWIPIFLAQFLAVYMQFPASYPVALVIAAGYALQAVAALYLLNLFKFCEKEHEHNIFVFVGVAFLATTIEPAIATIYQAFTHTLMVSPLFNFGRAWIAGVFSVLVLVPFFLTWYKQQLQPTSRAEKFELAAAHLLLFGMVYLLFWTNHVASFGISVIFYLPAVLFWFAVRFPLRWTALALFLSSVGAVTGTLLVNPGRLALNEQLLANEVYLGLLAAIFLIFTRLVEDRRNAIMELKKAYWTTRDADKAKSDFIAILAHELRNPLAPLVSSIELLKLQPQTKEASEYLDIIDVQATMISRILEDLLDTARLSQNKFSLQIEAIDLRDIIDQSINVVTDIMQLRHHTLITYLPKGEMCLFADPVRIKQIIINLLINAAKYTPNGGKISLKVKHTGKFFCIEIADNGVGIERDMITRIFEPFVQVPASTRHGSGLGIGLFLTKNLVEMHGGTIEATSDGIGRGSMFNVCIPVSTSIPVPLNTHIPHRFSKNTTTPLRVLIVDDNKPAANTLAKLLRYHGHEVSVSYSGAHALVTLDTFLPQLIILDLKMPEMNGYEVLEKIKCSGSTAKIVALSGYGQETDFERSRAAGFDDHLIKPVSAKDILRILASIDESSIIHNEALK